MVIFSLLIVLLAGNGQAASYSRDFTTEAECQAAADAAHEAAKRALGVADVGTVCIKSDFSNPMKPRV